MRHCIRCTQKKLNDHFVGEKNDLSYFIWLHMKCHTKYDYTARIFYEIEKLAIYHKIIEKEYTYTDDQIRDARKGLIKLPRPEDITSEPEIGEYILTKYDTYKDFIKDAFDPFNNGFKLVTLNESTKLPDNNEIWFSKPCYVMPTNVYEILEEWTNE